MTDVNTPIFSLARSREMTRNAVERAVREERQKCAAALEIQANTIGGVVGAALREVAEQVRTGSAIGASIVGTAERRVRGAMERAEMEADPAFNYDIEFKDLTVEQRQRRLARLAEESRQAAETLAAAQRADDERIEREKAEGRAQPATDSLVVEQPEVRVTSDDEDFHRAQSPKYLR
jgi:hypothetical protein